jgi:hypothetical protein
MYRQRQPGRKPKTDGGLQNPLAIRHFYTWQVTWLQRLTA